MAPKLANEAALRKVLWSLDAARVNRCCRAANKGDFDDVNDSLLVHSVDINAGDFEEQGIEQGDMNGLEPLLFRYE